MTVPSVSIDMFGIEVPARVKWTPRVREFAEAVAAVAAPHYADHKNVVFYNFRISSEKGAETAMRFDTVYTIPTGSHSLEYATELTNGVLGMRGVTSVISDVEKCLLTIYVRIDKTHKADLVQEKPAKK